MKTRIDMSNDLLIIISIHPFHMYFERIMITSAKGSFLGLEKTRETLGHIAWNR